MTKIKMTVTDVHQPVKQKVDSLALQILGPALVLLLFVEMELEKGMKFVMMEQMGLSRSVKMTAQGQQKDIPAHMDILLDQMLNVYQSVEMDSLVLKSNVKMGTLQMEMDAHQPVKSNQDSFALWMYFLILAFLRSVEMELELEEKFVTME